MLRTRDLSAEVEEGDGLRISVMPRDSHSPANSFSYDKWLPVLAPPKKLINAYTEGDLSWEDFANAYSEHMSKKKIREVISDLGMKALDGHVTLLSKEDSKGELYRKIIAEECTKYWGSLALDLK